MAKRTESIFEDVREQNAVSNLQELLVVKQKKNIWRNAGKKLDLISHLFSIETIGRQTSFFCLAV